MTGQEIRRRFLAHFESRDHLVLDSASLVPVDDPTTLFVSAGMQPLQPYYQGLAQPPAPRIVSCQRVVRTWDIDEVGKTDRHATFFEMLGNFAPTGDYFKETAIELAWSFATDPERGLGLDPALLSVTTHPSDDEARRIWGRVAGLPEDHLYEREDNWWGLGVGPAGPDSELWFDRGPEHGCGEAVCYPDHREDCQRHLEFWNLVFPTYDVQRDGSRPVLPHPGIDTGMGLERVASLVQGVGSIFDTDLMTPMTSWVHEHSTTPRIVAERVIADHLRTMTFIVADGVRPANEGRGYVLRRLIRHAALEARRAGLRAPLDDGVRLVVDEMRGQYPYLTEREADVRLAVRAEAEAFAHTLDRGLELFERMAQRSDGVLAGDDAFRLHDTEGFPIELTRQLASERHLAMDEAGFERAMTAQRERSRTTVVHSWADLRSLPHSEFLGYTQLEVDAQVVLLRTGGAEVTEVREGQEAEVYLDRTPFYAEAGGQVGDTGTLTGPDGELRVEDTRRPLTGVIAQLGRAHVGRLRVGDRVQARVDAPRRRQIMRHHSATHLLNRALEEILDRRNLQRGSWVGPDHTTFDFALDRALTEAEQDRLAARVTEQIRQALPLRVRVLPYAEAAATGATHLFDEKYGDEVRVVSFGDWSSEFCGGTHVATSADVGPFLVLGETSVGQGLRRLDAIAGIAAEEVIRRRQRDTAELARTLGVAAG
ncbi:MAG: alanine--tRNA ligase, partial [Candidatus Dormiibacterota bacterium]